eukprot:5412113-Pleurochrysis_carterae.AAC.1
MANVTGLPRLHSLARCCCAAHAPASKQAPRSGALKPLPHPHSLRSRLHPLACSPLAPRGLQTKKFSPPRAKNNTTNKEARSPQTSPPRVEPSMGHASFSHSESALLAYI